MCSMLDRPGLVTGGVDTHLEVHVAVVVDEVGRVLGTEDFAADARGYRALLGWMHSFGPLDRVGVEGTGAYGMGLARYLAGEGVAVVEVLRPNRQARRRRGKSDPADAEAAARAALNGEASGCAKVSAGVVASIRALQVARRGAVKAATAALNQLKDLVVTAPDELRARLSGLSNAERAELAARFRVRSLDDPVEATKMAMRAIGRRYQALQDEIARLDAALADLIPEAATDAFLAKQGVGLQVAATIMTTVGANPDRLRSEASFAALCGAAPVDASSGKQVRHRLNRGGDRQANSALWRIVFTRMTFDPRTKAYVERRTKEGKTNKEIIRCLKRYVAREIYRSLVAPPGDKIFCPRTT
jgi:transposase